MGLGNYAGRARLDRNRPSAQAECDRCGVWYNLDVLSKQYQWQGVALSWIGYLVCNRCNDVPQEQMKTLILPVDPLPRINPRPSPDVTPPFYFGSPPTSPFNQGWSVFELGMAAPKNGMYPIVKADVLAAVAMVSGIQTPTNLVDHSTVIARGVPTQILGANSFRTWVLIYNPTNRIVQFSLGSVTWGGLSNLQIGAGEAYLWSLYQNLAPVYAGNISAVGQQPNQALYVWDTGSSGLGQNGGILYVEFPPDSYPLGSDGLPPGSVYLVPNFLPSDQYAIGVVPGIVPDPLAPPLFFGTVTAAQLLVTGGGNLPTTNPGHGLNQLWNNGGLIVLDNVNLNPPTFVLNDPLLDQLDNVNVVLG